MAFLLTRQQWCAIIVTKINRNLRAVPTAVILKLSGGVMRVFQCTCFRKLIAVNQNLSVRLFVSSSLYRMSDVDFHWARGANARGTTQERGEALLRRLSPLSLRFSLSRSPFPDSLLSIWFRIRFWFAEHRGSRDQESGGSGAKT